MNILENGEFANEKTVVIEVKSDGPTTHARPTINGKTLHIKNNTPTRVPQAFADVLIEAGYRITVLDGSDAKGASDPVGGDGEGADAGDPLMSGPGVSDTTGTVTPVTPSQQAALDAQTAKANGKAEAPRGKPASSFDPEAAIDGTVEDVIGRLNDLSLSELESLDAAEADREKPRVGVRAAIASAIAQANEAKKAN